MANNQITFGVGFQVDKSGLNQLKTSLNEISKMTTKDFMKINPNLNLDQARTELSNIRNIAQTVEAALNKAFNPKLGTVNIKTFNQTLTDSKTSVKEIYTNFSKAGVAGQNAFRNLAMSTTHVNLQLKETKGVLDKMAETLANTIKWNLASGAVNALIGSIQQAVGFVKNLDTSLNDIRIVTEKSADEMKIFAENANMAAKSLGQSTRNYTDAALIYYQQGKGDAESQRLAEITLKAANVTGQTGAEVSEQLTAIWNGYKVSASEAELYIDKVAAVAAATAADLEELSTGMSKVASAANAMGVDVDQLNAQLATIVSVTRQAPESVGTALKTIYARMTDLKLGGTDEDGMGLGKVSGQLADVGIQILDESGNLRDMGTVIEEVAAKWDTWGEAQRIAVAQVMAGTRQYNNLVALFDSWDMYTDALETSANAAGTLNKQQNIYMESTKAHLQQLSTAQEDLYKSLLDTDTINTVADVFRELIELTTTWVDSLGGGLGVLKTLGSVGVGIFSKQIAGGINNLYANRDRKEYNRSQIQYALDNAIDYQQQSGVSKEDSWLYQKRADILKSAESMSKEEFDTLQAAVEDLAQSFNKANTAKKELEDFNKILQNLSDMANLDLDLSKSLNEEDWVKIGNAAQAMSDDFENARQSFSKLDKIASNNKITKSMKDMHDAVARFGKVDFGEEFKREYEKVIASQQKFEELQNNIDQHKKGKKVDKAYLEQVTAAYTQYCADLERLAIRIATARDIIHDEQDRNARPETFGPTKQQQSKDADNEKQAQEERVRILQTSSERQKTIEGIVDYVSGMTAIAQATDSVADSIQRLVSGEADFSEFLSNAVTNIPAFLYGIVELSRGIDALKEKFPNLGTIVAKVFGELITGVKSVKDIVTDSFKGITTSISSVSGASKTAITSLAGFSAAVLVLAGAWNIFKAVEKGAIEKRLKEIEEDKKAVEEALQSQDELTSVNSSFQQYQSLLSIYEKTGEGKDQLNNATKSLAEQ